VYGVGKARIRIGPVVLLHLHVEVIGKAVVVTCTNCDRGSGQSHGDLGVTWNGCRPNSDRTYLRPFSLLLMLKQMPL